jgi:hypothetical protein
MVSKPAALLARAPLANGPMGIGMKRANRRVDRSASANRGARWEIRQLGHFSIVPLQRFNRDISTAARRALVERRLGDAAKLLMREHGLSCSEAGVLLGVATC